MKMPLPAASRVALVTGGSSGIGLAIAQKFVADGWRVAIAARNIERLRDAADKLSVFKKDGQEPPLAVSLDLTDADSVARGVAQVLDCFGQIDALVANAAQTRKAGWPAATAQLALEDWEADIDTYLTGLFLINRAVIPSMRARGAGTIVNIGSALTPQGMRGRAFAPAYSAAKFAAQAYTEALAEEVRAFGIRVFSLLPGAVDTPLIARTALARDFGGAMQAGSLADIVLDLADMPGELALQTPIVMPFRGGIGKLDAH